MGGGKSSGSGTQYVTPQLTSEQKDILATQSKALKETFLPAYERTISGAGDAYNQAAPAANRAAQTAIDVSGRTGALQEAAGAGSFLTGLQGLQSLFDPNYERGQVNAALQAGRESARESQMGQNAMYGGAGGLGSARMALADKNLSSLNAQRQATAAAEAQAKVQANKAAAANQLATLGSGALSDAQKSAAARISYAQTPQDVYGKYASVVFGVPQASTTPNFSGTQGQTSTSSGRSKGFGF
jgi:hypothetical protein